MLKSEEQPTKQLCYKFHNTSTSKTGSKLSINEPEEPKLILRYSDMIKKEETLSQANRRWYVKPSTIIHILVTIFGISTWIGVNGIFIQLPVLVNSSPESWRLAAYLVVVIQAANLVPIIYSLLRKFTLKISESNCILGMLGIDSLAIVLLAFLYNKTSTISGSEHSTALFVLTFFTAGVSCTSSVLFMPYLRNFKEIYLISYFIGEGLSGFIPSIVALIQSIGESSTCNNNSNNTLLNNTLVSHVTFPRFSSQYYFLFLFGCLILSLISFLLLENLSFIKKEKKNFCSSDNNTSNNEIENFPSERKRSVLSENSITENNIIGNHVFIHNHMKIDVGEIPNINYTQNNNIMTLTNLYLYILLCVICLLANGLLPSLQPYSCMSYGNMTYHLSAIFSQIANPTACLLALWFLPQSIKIINWLSIVIFFLSSYIIYLALNSLNSPLRDSRIGKALVILFWILLIGLISYVKLMITSVFRRKSEKTLFPVGAAMQTGSACGAILSFILINYTKLLQEYKPCHSLDN